MHVVDDHAVYIAALNASAVALDGDTPLTRLPQLARCSARAFEVTLGALFLRFSCDNTIAFSLAHATDYTASLQCVPPAAQPVLQQLRSRISAVVVALAYHRWLQYIHVNSQRLDVSRYGALMWAHNQLELTRVPQLSPPAANEDASSDALVGADAGSTPSEVSPTHEVTTSAAPPACDDLGSVSSATACSKPDESDYPAQSLPVQLQQLTLASTASVTSAEGSACSAVTPAVPK